MNHSRKNYGNTNDNVPKADAVCVASPHLCLAARIFCTPTVRPSVIFL